MCARCEELEERVAFLESELGIQRDDEVLRKLRRAYGVMPCVAKVLVRLASGRSASLLQLEEYVEPKSSEPPANYIRMLICKGRVALGKDAIETLHGFGYRMTPAGVAKIKAALAEPQKAAA